MIRPFSIVHLTTSPKGKYHFFDHRSNELAVYKSIPEHFFEKLLSHPITAFGYRFVDINPDINPRFSKHDIIRSLDFWIEHWIYENQKESVLTGTVNVDHEITLKELILVREKIMKMPVETQFTRGKIRVPEVDYSKGAHNINYEKTDHNGVRKFYHYDGDDDRVITNMTDEEIRFAEKRVGESFKKKGHYKKIKKLPEKIVFTEAVFVEDSSTDPFCHKVVEMTREEYEKKVHCYPSGIKHLNGLADATNIAVQDILNSFVTASESIRAAAMFSVPTPPLEPQLQIGDIVIWDRESNSFRTAGIDDDISKTIRLSTETQSPEFLRWVTTGTFVIPEDTHLIAGDMMNIRNDSREIVVAHGTVAEDLHPGDVVRLDGNNRWIKIPPLNIQGSDVR